MTQTPEAPDPAAPRRYKKRPPAVWLAIRAGWECGLSERELAERYDVTAAAIKWRARNHGWTRIVAPTAPTRAGDPWPHHPPAPPVRIAEAGLARALEALIAGRPADAIAMVKAADAIGEFADFVRRKREEEARAGESGDALHA